MTVPRAVVIGFAVPGALVIGGVAQAYAWRLGHDGLTDTTNSQFGWMLLCFVVAWAWARGRVASGLLAGALTGMGLTASYYCVQWLAEGAHSALSQLTGSHGLAWTVAATCGGALVGVLGALASSRRERHPPRKAGGVSTAALIVGLGPLGWFAVKGDSFNSNGIWVPITFYGAVGVSLALIGLRECGFASFLRGLLIGASAALVMLAGLLVLQGTVLYTTF